MTKTATKSDIISRIRSKRSRLASYGVLSIGLFWSSVRDKKSAP